MLTDTPRWYAIRTHKDFLAAEILAPQCDEVFLPYTIRHTPLGRERKRPLIPHVLFIRTSRRNAISMELAGRMAPDANLSFWIYRYPDSPDPQVISPRSIELLRLLTADTTDTAGIYHPAVFTPGQRVRITGGMFEGYEGFVKRVGRDRRVIVEIEGICMVLLPFIDPALLSPL